MCDEYMKNQKREVDMGRFIATFVLLFILGNACLGQEIAELDTTGLDSLKKAFEQFNPELRIQEAKINVAKEKYFQEKMSFLRNLRIGIQFNQANSTLEEQTMAGLVPKYGLNLSLDLESIITTSSRTKVAKLELEQARWEYQKTKTTLENQLYLEWINFKRALKAYEDALEVFRMADQAYKIAKKKFANGEIQYTELAAQMETHSKAYTKLLDAQVAVHQAKAALMDLIGK